MAPVPAAALKRLIAAGGPAAPVVVDLDEGTYQSVGLTLRDWFAGQALIGMMNRYTPFSSNYVESAEIAYRQADAMLAAREALR